MLVHIISAGEETLRDLTFTTDCDHLAAWVIKLIRIIRKQIEVQTVLSKLLLVERSLASSDGDITRRQLRRRKCLRIKRDRQTRPSQASWETCLSGRCRVCGQTIESVDKVAGERISSNLCVIHRIAAANGRT